MEGIIYLNKKKNILVIEVSDIVYIEYKRSSYSSILPVPKFMIKIIEYLKRSISLKGDKYYYFGKFKFNGKSVRLIKLVSRNLKISSLNVKFENEENYNFHNSDLNSKVFNDFLKKNFLNTRVNIIRKKNEKFIPFSFIIKVENEISKKYSKIIETFYRTYSELPEEILKNVNTSIKKLKLTDAISVLKRINLVVSLYNFLSSRITEFLTVSGKINEREKFVKRVIEIEKRINMALNELEKYLVEKLESKKIDIAKLKFLAKKCCISKRGILLFKNTSTIIPLREVRCLQMKEIKCKSIVHSRNMKGICVLLDDISTGKTVEADSVVIINSYSHDILGELLKKTRNIIIEKSTDRISRDMILRLRKMKVNLIHLKNASQLIPRYCKIEIRKDRLKILD